MNLCPAAGRRNQRDRLIRRHGLTKRNCTISCTKDCVIGLTLMNDTNFVDSHRFSAAFVANQLERLVDVIVTQGNDMLDAAGIRFPSRTVSTVLFVGENAPTSTADIARALGQPHQLATQRVDLLTQLGIFERISDPDDARRKLLRLTPEGRDQFKVLTGRLEKAGQAFETLFAEIGCDLPAVSRRAADALHESSLLTRMKAI